MSEKKYVDFSTVRDLLQKANDAREEQSQEQQRRWNMQNGRK